MEQKSGLEQRIEYLQEQNRQLQESVGRWKRLAQGKHPRFNYIAERHERGQHYISVPVHGLPSDSPLHEAQQYIRNNILPLFYPYRYWSCYTSHRSQGWVVTLVKEDKVINMNKVLFSDEFQDV